MRSSKVFKLDVSKRSSVATMVIASVVAIEVFLLLLGSPHLRLLGVEQGKLAIIEDTQTGNQDVFDLGAVAFGSVRLVEIAPSYIVVEENGERRKISGKSAITLLEDGELIREISKENRFSADGDLKRIPQLLMEAQPAPVVTAGKIIGVELTSIPTTSTLAAKGLSSNDVIISVNGFPVRSAHEALMLMRQAPEHQIAVTVQRGKKELKLYL